MDQDIQGLLATGEQRAAFELLLDRYQDRIYRLACGMLRNETWAEDIAQDALIRIWKALPGFKGTASLSTWIYTITRNACLTALKKHASRPTLSLQETDCDEPADLFSELRQDAQSAATGMDVDVMLAELPEKYRRVLVLFYLEQRSYEEVSAMLALPMGTVKTYLHRAKRDLAAIIARQDLVEATC